MFGKINKLPSIKDEEIDIARNYKTNYDYSAEKYKKEPTNSVEIPKGLFKVKKVGKSNFSMRNSFNFNNQS